MLEDSHRIWWHTMTYLYMTILQNFLWTITLTLNVQCISKSFPTNSTISSHTAKHCSFPIPQLVQFGLWNPKGLLRPRVNNKQNNDICWAAVFFRKSDPRSDLNRFTDPNKNLGYLITRSQLSWSGVRWCSVPFNFWWLVGANQPPPCCNPLLVILSGKLVISFAHECVTKSWSAQPSLASPHRREGLVEQWGRLLDQSLIRSAHDFRRNPHLFHGDFNMWHDSTRISGRNTCDCT